MTMRLVVDQPFDLALSLEMGQTFRWRRVGDEDVRDRDWGHPPERWRTGGGWYSGVLGEFLVHVRQMPGGMEYRVGDEAGEREDIDLEQGLRDYFRLDDDITAVYSEITRDPVVKRAVEQYPGLRLLRQDPWECLASYVCSRVQSIRGTRGDVETIARLSRRTVRIGDDVRHVFPAPMFVAHSDLAAADPGLGLSRARDIVTIAGSVERDALPLDRAGAGAEPSADVVRRLDGYPGVGPKIASCVALMALDSLDAFPVDRWVQRAIAKCDLSEMPHGRGRRSLAEKIECSLALTDAQQYQVAAWARARFGAYAGYAGQYLFHWAEPHKERAVRGDCPVCGPDRR
ncbi:MAG: DNA glycosylase [Chloroflexi bacterium]|nr:DNA glycosylase [Chloroflexota bacterium]